MSFAQTQENILIPFASEMAEPQDGDIGKSLCHYSLHKKT
jgi:hypothetical protein